MTPNNGTIIQNNNNNSNFAARSPRRVVVVQAASSEDDLLGSGKVQNKVDLVPETSSGYSPNAPVAQQAGAGVNHNSTTSNAAPRTPITPDCGFGAGESASHQQYANNQSNIVNRASSNAPNNSFSSHKVVNRAKTISLRHNPPSNSASLEDYLHSNYEITDIDAIFGCLRLNSGIYVCLVYDSEKVTDIASCHSIRMVKKMQWICVFHPKKGHAHNEHKYIQLLNAATNQYGKFYYVQSESDGSIRWDITRSVQKQQHVLSEEVGSAAHPLETLATQPGSASFSTADGTQKFYFQMPNEEFFWNKHASDCFLDAGLYEFVTPMIKGFASGFEVQLKKQQKKTPLHFWLISRLSCKRAGTRYHTRGLDEFGNVANFVETEQIIMFEDRLTSFLQVRGSIPLFWDQSPDLSYNPEIKLQQRNSSVGYQTHMQNQIKNYGDIVCISLINLKGVELALANEFEKQHKLYNNPRVRYIAWDFHKECSGMRYSNINKLVSKIEEDMQQFGYFSYNMSTQQVEREQHGVIRSNCKDCLDRTNVVMSSIAKVMVKRLLQEHNLISPRQTINRLSPPLSYYFKVAWADNGDALSQMYAGTGALKSDFTRTGKRTFYGLLQDLQNSATRYYLNNFSDGVKQDSINLLLGKHDVLSEQTPFGGAGTNSWSYLYTLLWIALFVGVLGSFASVFLFFMGSNYKRRFMDLCFWILFTVCVYTVLKKNGSDVANQPILTIREVFSSSQSDDNKKTE